MNTNLFLAIAELPTNLGPYVATAIIAVVIIMVGYEYFPTKSNKQRWAFEKFEEDFKIFHTADEVKLVVQWRSDCSVIMRKEDKQFVRISKNNKGFFTEEPYPVFEEESASQS